MCGLCCREWVGGLWQVLARMELTLALVRVAAAARNWIAISIPQRGRVPAVLRSARWATAVGALHRNVGLLVAIILLLWLRCAMQRNSSKVAVDCGQRWAVSGSIATHCTRDWSKAGERANQPVGRRKRRRRRACLGVGPSSSKGNRAHDKAWWTRHVDRPWPPLHRRRCWCSEPSLAVMSRGPTSGQPEASGCSVTHRRL